MSSSRIKSVFPALSALTLALMVAACGPIISFGDDGPADDVFTLRYEGDYTSASLDGPLIYIEEPYMSDGLAGLDVPVLLANGQRTFLKGVAWSANSSDLVRDYMVRSLSAADGVGFIGKGALDIKAGCYLRLQVWEFEYVPGTTLEQDRVQVAMELSLVRYSDSNLISRPTYRASESVNGSGSQAVMLAFQRAMKTVATPARTWVEKEGRSCAL